MKNALYLMLLATLCASCSQSTSYEELEQLVIKDQGIVLGVNLGDDRATVNSKLQGKLERQQTEGGENTASWDSYENRQSNTDVVYASFGYDSADKLNAIVLNLRNPSYENALQLKLNVGKKLLKSLGPLGDKDDNTFYWYAIQPTGQDQLYKASLEAKESEDYGGMSFQIIPEKNDWIPMLF